MAATTNDGGIASNNIFDLLGNDPELDPDREPEPAPKVIDKPVQRTGKRNAGPEGPGGGASRAAGGGRGGRPQTETWNDTTRGGAGAPNNRARWSDDGLRGDRHPDRPRGPNEHRDTDGRPRGSRGGNRGSGGRGTRPARDDRHSKTGLAEHPKQADHAWGGPTGEGEWADEKAGEAMAQQEEAATGLDPTGEKPVDENGNPVDSADAPTDPDAASAKQKSFDDYMAEQAERKLAIGGTLQARQPNEGAKVPPGKALARDPHDEEFMAASNVKSKRERERKTKNFLDVDQSWDESALRQSDSGRGGRGRGGRPRGDGFRGEGRGRGRGAPRGGGEVRGPPRGGSEVRGPPRGGGEVRGPPRGGSEVRGAPRGGTEARGPRGGGRGGSNLHIQDEKAFPSLTGNK